MFRLLIRAFAGRFNADRCDDRENHDECFVVISRAAGRRRRRLPLPAFAQARRSRMTIATGVDPSFAPFYVAKEGGFFERNGLDVTVNTGPSGSAMIAFLIGNQINSAYGAEQAGVSAHCARPERGRGGRGHGAAALDQRARPQHRAPWTS